jgi:hypothetical protein
MRVFIFIGLMEIANFAYAYSKGFRSLGHQTYTAVFSKNLYYPSSKHDVEILREWLPLEEICPRGHDPAVGVPESPRNM